MTPQPVKNAIHAIWLCIGLSVIAALVDRLTGRMPAGDFAFSVIVYGISVMIPYKLARRSNATRFVLAVLIAGSIIGWLGGLTAPLPPFSKIVTLLQIPIIAVTMYWLFFIPDVNDWFAGRVEHEHREPVVERIEPKL